MTAARVLTAMLLAGTAVLAVAAPAAACSIVVPGPSEQELVDRADLVFVGVAVGSQDQSTGATVVSSADPVTWTFTVEQVVKGTPSNPQSVNTARGSASCGFPFQPGLRYLVFASSDGGTYTTALGSGTREVTATTTTTPPPTPPTPPTTTVPPRTPHTTVATSVLPDRGRLPDTGTSGAALFLAALALMGAGAFIRRQVRRAR